MTQLNLTNRTMRSTTSTLALVLVGASLMVGCSSELTGTIPEPPTGTGGEVGNTFDHDNSGVDPFELLERLQQEGPATYSSRVHSCAKMRLPTIRNLLVSRGVDMDTGGPKSPAGLYNSGQNALGAPNYGARVRENIEITTASASRLFDIYAAAAPELIANFEARPECAGAGPLFTGNTCNIPAISCLIGVPALLQHAELCNITVTSSSTVEIGKQLAVAALMAAAHTCE